MKSESDERTLCFLLRSHTHSHSNSLSEEPSSATLRRADESDELHSVFYFALTLTLTLFKKKNMFDFEKLEVYKKAKIFNAGIRQFLKEAKLDPTTNDQLRRASFSIVLNLAEGSGRFSKADRRNFFVIARSSIFECVAILDVLKDENALEITKYNAFYQQAEELSKIIFAMIKNLSK